MQPDEITRGQSAPESYPDDPSRDALLTARMRRYEADAQITVDDLFRARLAHANADALRSRYAQRWYVVTGRMGRFVIPIGLAAAAASVFLAARVPERTPTGIDHLMLSAAVGVATPSALDELWTATANCDTDVMCKAFGVVAPR
jgi:hypothetical protein